MTSTYRRQIGRLGRLARWLSLLAMLSLLMPSCGVQADDGEELRPLEMPEGRPRPVPGEPDYEPGRVLVRYEEGASTAVRSQALSAADAAPIETVTSAVDLVQVPVGQELAMVEELSAQPGVLAAQLDYHIYALGSPDDPYLDRQWFHTLIGSAAGWDLTTGSEDVMIAVIDSGIDMTHPDLSGNIIYGRDFTGSSSDREPDDRNGHGTHVAGLIGATTNNGLGVAGMDWQADMLILRVLNSEGKGDVSDLISAIDYATDFYYADVINLSLGGYSGACGTVLQDEIDDAYNSGTVIVAAMGNDATVDAMYPAACDHVIAVVATDRNDSRADYSNWGGHADLAAPGGEIDAQEGEDIDGIYSTMPTYEVTANDWPDERARNYDYWAGTSMAAPLVSGLSALILALNPSLSPDEVREVMERTAVDLGEDEWYGWDRYYGWGRIDVASALEYAQPPSRVEDLGIVSLTDEGEGKADIRFTWTPPERANSITIYCSDNPITSTNWYSADVVAAGIPADATDYLAEDAPYWGGTVYCALRADGIHFPGSSWSQVSNNGFWPARYELLLPFVGVDR